MTQHVILTEDDSVTIYLPEINETYHSTKGAISESVHVYIEAGLEYTARNKKNVKIFEFGFGTGLNALLTWKYAEDHQLRIVYDSVEKYPLSEKVYSQLNYDQQLFTSGKLLTLHKTAWNENMILSPIFIFHKSDTCIEDFAFPAHYYDLIFFDAFGPSKQAEAWDMLILEKMYKTLSPGGILVTYSSQGQFRRNLETLGFKVQKIPGPAGKREMTRAIKE